MASHHEHELQDDTYFLDQICMTALSGTFGVICLALCFVQTPMLKLLLGEQFHPFVLASGVALVLIAAIRAAMLWSIAGGRASAALQDEVLHAADQHCCDPDHEPHDHTHSHAALEHDHAHSHSHAHSHGDHGHSHSHGDASHSHSEAIQEVAQSRAFGHTPAPITAPAAAPNPAHGHSHSHGDGADHDHGWAPWRYVVLLAPITLFLLGLPNKGPSIDTTKLSAAVEIPRDTHEEAAFAAALTAFAHQPLGTIGLLAIRNNEEAQANDFKDARTVNVKELSEFAEVPATRDFWKGKVVKVKGQYFQRSARMFSLVRFRIQCCAGDAVQVDVPVVSKDNVPDVKAQSWVEVTGRVEFRSSQGKMMTVLMVPASRLVQTCNPDVNPYLQ